MYGKGVQRMSLNRSTFGGGRLAAPVAREGEK
jgi:hypothetical protein